MPVAEVYVTRYSIQNLTEQTTIDELETLLEKLQSTLSEYNYSNNVAVKCAQDLLDFQIENTALSDDLFEIVNDDMSAWTYYLDRFEKITTQYVEYNNTEGMVSVIENNPDNQFPRCYAFILESNQFWPTFPLFPYTYSWSHTLQCNSEYIANNHTSATQFIEWSKLNYEYLDFHEDIEQTLNTIKIGGYSNYKKLLSHAMNCLNQCYHFVSSDPTKNQEDLLIISEYTGKLGRKLTCTRQGSNKVSWSFKKINAQNANERESVNCEYHLKINWDDSGNRIPHGNGNPVRVYFGMKSYDGIERKQFKLTHLGKHL